MLGCPVENVVLTEKEFRTISEIVYEHCGINLHDGKKELVRARLAKRLRALSIPSFDEYLKYALKDPTGDEFTTMIDSISTNLTSFFRESQHFKYLNDIHYPAMLSKKAAKGEYRIRAWSAGCSSGEEPYTMAITLLDAINNNSRWDVKVLATDISTKVLGKAREGVYEAARVEPVSAQQKQKYLVMQKRGSVKAYKVSQALKDVVVFGHLNLMQQWPVKGPVDFIFCRNVMIYFDKPTQERLVNRFWDILAPGGLLFTGHSESLTGINHKFRYVKPTIYAKP